MKKIITGIICLSILFGCASNWQKVLVNNDESSKIHAVWLSYVDYQEMLQGKSENEFREAVGEMITNLESLGINRIYTQVSMFTDAIYQSSYYPWSMYASGKLNKSCSFDPLEIIISEASIREIVVEAWINPMRSLTVKQMKEIDDLYPIKQWYNDEQLREKNLMLVDNRYYLNPGSQDVVDNINGFVKEIIDKYQVVGIHIDDYFYPTGISNEDDITYQEYLINKPETKLADYRRDCTDRLVLSLCNTAHVNKVKFSISPSANIETNYSSYYADVEKWLTTSGYCDYMIPQVYFGFENSNAPFEEIVNQWESIKGKKVQLIFGLAAYKVGYEDEWAGSGSDEWIENVDILSRQVEYVSKQNNYAGIALFRYLAMFNPDKKVKQQMKIELTKLKEALN